MIFRRYGPVGAVLILVGFALTVAGCAREAGDTDSTLSPGMPGGPAATAGAPITAPGPDTSELEPIVVPTLPDVIPGYTEVDPDTGLHVTGTPQVIDLASYRLKVSGKVAHELSLTFDDLRVLPKMTATPRLVCVGVFTDTATWSGAPLGVVLEMAEVQPDAEEIKMVSADGYYVFLDLEDALRPENFLAYELMGEPLPVLHGFPLRAVIPDKNGNYWVKWLQEIVVE
jgi:DMSO/TMAO reductase YedYZ molybdopterin-dependent catalytic subunit